MASTMSNVEAGLAAGGLLLSKGIGAYSDYKSEKSKEQPPEDNSQMSPKDEESLRIVNNIKEALERIWDCFDGEEEVDWKKLQTSQALDGAMASNDNIKSSLENKSKLQKGWDKVENLLFIAFD